MARKPFKQITVRQPWLTEGLIASGVTPGAISTTELGGDITTAGIALLDDVDASAQRTTLGLGTAATQPSSAFATAVHTHIIGDTTGLQAALDAKAATVHTHTVSDFVSVNLNDIAAPDGSVNFNQQQATQFRIENRTSDPGSPASGEMWLRTDL